MNNFLSNNTNWIAQIETTSWGINTSSIVLSLLNIMKLTNYITPLKMPAVSIVFEKSV